MANLRGLEKVMDMFIYCSYTLSHETSQSVQTHSRVSGVSISRNVVYTP